MANAPDRRRRTAAGRSAAAARRRAAAAGRIRSTTGRRTPNRASARRVKRLDGPDKVTGRAKYTFDIKRPGMLYGRIVRSPHPHARVVSVDLSAAQRAPGVKAALVHRDPAGRRRPTS